MDSVSVENLQPGAQLSSPRSLEACIRLGYDSTDLIKLSFEEWKTKHPVADELRFKRYLAKYDIKLREVKAERQRIVRSPAKRHKFRTISQEPQRTESPSQVSLAKRSQPEEPDVLAKAVGLVDNSQQTSDTHYRPGQTN
jgi:hypothetical protein